MAGMRTFDRPLLVSAGKVDEAIELMRAAARELPGALGDALRGAAAAIEAEVIPDVD